MPYHYKFGNLGERLLVNLFEELERAFFILVEFKTTKFTLADNFYNSKQVSRFKRPHQKKRN